MKIIALLPVRNEEWVLEHCLKSLSFVDEILAIDDRSTDRTGEILKKYNCTILNLDTDVRIGWKEYEIRSYLLNEARKRNATHLLAIDGDEEFSEEFQKDAREIFSKLTKGQGLQMEWLTLCSESAYLKPRIYKTFAMMDDLKSNHDKSFLHVSRVPETGTKPLLLENKYCVYHYQYINQERMRYKQAWYMASEFVKKNRSAKRINNTYSYVTHGVCSPLELNMPTPRAGLPDPKKDNSIWQKDSLVNLLKEKGVEFFEPIDIWFIKDLNEMFKEKTGRNPRPEKFLKILILISRIKNKIYYFLKQNLSY